ncbi:MAG: DnaD domain protein [Eubacteriales bacterium]|nr:DnaD domain protein [Eubacteriales bacterium]
MKFASIMNTGAVLLPEIFISKYMPEANGDYVKVMIYIMSHPGAVNEEIADALSLTEGDVKRAVKYWQEKELLEGTDNKEKEAMEDKKTKKDPLRELYSGTKAAERLEALSMDSDFQQLLIIAQTYRSKIMDEKEVQVMAYLYDGLKLPLDVLDYLVAYSVEKDHNDIRYIEKLGRDWAEIGIRTEKQARNRTKQFEKGETLAKGTRRRGTSSGSAASYGTGNGAEGCYAGATNGASTTAASRSTGTAGKTGSRANSSSRRTDYNELLRQ